jgi:hypothetical protein
LAAGLTTGCIVNHELGETATEGDDESTSDSPGTGGTSGASNDGGSQSNTSATPTSDTGDSGDTGEDSGTTGDPVDCELSQDFVTWFPSDFVDPIPGLDASFAAVLQGPCTASYEALDGIDTYVWQVDLSCTLSGRIDGDAALVDQAVDMQLTFESSQPPEAYVGSLTEDMQLRVVADWWGMGWNRWFVLSRLDGTIVLDGIDGEFTDPLSSIWSEDVATMLGGEPWHGGLAVGVGPAECGTLDGKCGEEARALDFGWGDGETTPLHSGQAGNVGTDVQELAYGTYVTSALEIPMPTCSDTPLGDFRMTTWAIEP